MNAWAPGDIEQAEKFMRAQARRHRPKNQLPVTVPLDLLLLDLPDLVAFVSALAVYRNGVEFALELRARPSAVDENLLDDALRGHNRSEEKRLLLGVEFADGRRASTLTSNDGWPDDDPAQPALIVGSGGGGSLSTSDELFLSPLPPPGDCTLVVAWPHHGVAETTFALPTDEILDAAAQVRELWPWEPARLVGRPSPTSPAVAEGGWFAAELKDGDPED